MFRNTVLIASAGLFGLLANAADQSAMSAQDQKFVMNAAKGGMMEVHMGHMGQQHGSSAAVKSFAQKIIDDHTKANDELAAIAKRKGITLPGDTSASMHKPFESKSGSDFDQAYAKDMVSDHQKDIAEFQKEANSGSDPDLKAWASQTLPTLQGHLAAAKQLLNK